MHTAIPFHTGLLGEEVATGVEVYRDLMGTQIADCMQLAAVTAPPKVESDFERANAHLYSPMIGSKGAHRPRQMMGKEPPFDSCCIAVAVAGVAAADTEKIAHCDHCDAAGTYYC